MRIVERWLLGRLRHRVFYSLAEVNAAIGALLADLNDRRVLRRVGRTRRQLFEEVDRPAIRALPGERYVYAEWRIRRAGLDYHVEVTQILAATETVNKRLYDEWLDTAITYKVEWEREIPRCKRLGIEPLSPLPHPDHIVIDMRTGKVQIKGPMTKEEQQHLDWLRDRKVEFAQELADLEQLLIDEPDYPHRKFVEDDIEHDRKIVAMIGKVMPD